MPRLPDTPRTVLVRTIGSRNGTAWNNTYHLQYSGAPPTDAELDIVCTGIVNAWGLAFALLCPTDVTLTTVQAADIASATGASHELATLAPGTRVGTGMTNQVACVISWKINLRYRGGHPRTYLPAGVATDVLTQRLWENTFIDAATASAATWHSNLNGIVAGLNSFTFVAVSYFTNGALRATPLVLPITSEVVHNRIDTQRRRLGKETV
jgi:hypothetical protein